MKYLLMIIATIFLLSLLGHIGLSTDVAFISLFCLFSSVTIFFVMFVYLMEKLT